MPTIASNFLPARRKRCTGNSHHPVCVCVWLCLCVTLRYCIKTAKRRITQTTPRDSIGTLVFWRQNSLVDDPPLPPEICAQIDPPPFKQHDFSQYLLIASQPWELAKKVQLALIGRRPRVFQRAIDEPCTLPLTPPKGGTNRDFAIFPKSLLQSFFVWKLPAAKL